MTSLEQEIETVREQLDRQASLKSRLKRMKAQQAKLNWEVEQRKDRWHREEQDIDQLETFSWSALWARLNGQLEEKLSEQRREALVAGARFEAARRQQEALAVRIAQVEHELQDLKGSEQQWKRLQQQKVELLKQKQPDKAAVIFQFEVRQRECQRQLKELREAADIGKAARGLARRLVETMDDALTWSTVDLFGGGMMTDFIKHSRLEEAQKLAQQLEDQLRCFESELADVDIYASLELTVDPFLRILDILFDNFITDWTVQERMEKALAQAKTAEDEVQRLLDHLAAWQDQTQRENAEFDRQRRLLIEQISL